MCHGRPHADSLERGRDSAHPEGQVLRLLGSASPTAPFVPGAALLLLPICLTGCGGGQTTLLETAAIVRFDQGRSAGPMGEEPGRPAEGGPGESSGGDEVGKGQPFGVRFSLREAGPVIVLLVRADGSIALLEPASPELPLRRFEAGTTVTLPDADGAGAWSDPGSLPACRLVLAAFPDRPAGAGELLADARRRAKTSGRDPAQRSYAVLRALRAAGAEGVVLPLSGPPPPS